MPVGMRRVHDGRPRAEAAFSREQLDRAQAVLGEALVDLARLLVGVHVQRQVVLGGVAAELAQARRPGRRGRSGGRRRRGCRRRAAPRARAGSRPPTPGGSAGCRRAGNRRRGSTKLDARLGRGLGRRPRLLEAEVVELADRRVAVLAAARGRPATYSRADLVDASATPASAIIPSRHAQKSPPPAAAAQRALERMAMGVHESRESQHRRILSA